MKLRIGVLLVVSLMAYAGICAETVKPAGETPQGATKSAAKAPAKEPIKGLGMTQGEFAVLVIHEAHAERLFDGAVTGMSAAGKLATVGLAPKEGWNVKKPLTRKDLEYAYGRLMLSARSRKPTEERGKPVAKGKAPVAKEKPAVTVDVTRLSIPKLIDTIVDAVEKAFASIGAERQPMSPTGANWDF